MQLPTTARHRRRGVSSILATVLLFSMLATAGSAYVVSITNINLAYTHSLLNRVSSIRSAAVEALSVTPSLSGGHIKFYVNNTGLVIANITSVLVLDSSGNVLTYDLPPSVTCPTGVTCYQPANYLPVGVSPGRGTTTFDTGYTYVSGTDTVQVNTDRGNSFSGIYPALLPFGSFQAQSIGPLTANLQSMKWMQPTGNQQAGGLVAGYPTIAVAPAPQPLKMLSVDNSGANTCSNQGSCSVSITTSNTNDVIYLAVYDEGGNNQFPSVSDNSQLTWNQRQSAQVSTTYEVYTYYAIATAKLTSDSVTANFRNSADDWITYVAISNANTASPFDPNLTTAPTSSSTSSSTASVSFTTSNPNDIIVGAVKWDETAFTPTAAPGYTLLTFSSDNDAGFEYEVVGSTGQYTPSFGLSTSTWAEIGDAIEGYYNYVGSELPITLTNNQASATPSSFQQMIVWNPSLWASFEASDLGNVRFCADATCNTLLYSWLESCSPSCSSTASSATAWVLLPSSIAANGGALTIYMSFLSTSTEFDSNYWGEAPQLSPGWGQYDNGAKGFSFYDNFKGTTLNSGLWTVTKSSGGSYSVNNGITFRTGSSSDYVFISSTMQTPPLVAEAYMASETSADLLFGETTTSTANSWRALYYGYSLDYPSGTSTVNFAYQGSGSSSGFVAQPSRNSFPPGIWSVAWSATGKEYFSDGNGDTGTYTDGHETIGNYGIYVGVSDTSAGSSLVQWARMRAYPPSNVMPTVSFTGPGYVIFSALLTDEDPQGRGITLWPDSSISVVTTTRGGQQPSTTVVNFFIVDSVTGGTSPTGIVAYNSSASRDFTHLSFNVPTTVYFAASGPRGGTMNTLGNPTDPFQAMFALTGQYDDKSLYGQTIPFPSGISTKSVATLSAVSGKTGDTITVSGSGFMANSICVVGWIDSVGKMHVLTLGSGLTHFTTSASGSISGVTFTVPGSSTGYGSTNTYYTVVVTDFTNSVFFTFYHTGQQ